MRAKGKSYFTLVSFCRLNSAITNQSNVSELVFIHKGILHVITALNYDIKLSVGLPFQRLLKRKIYLIGIHRLHNDVAIGSNTRTFDDVQLNFELRSSDEERTRKLASPPHDKGGL
ncbi:hypothetical protein TNCV_1241211 [Trichonephila clavipes]|uniref:Uncharacterized protein n=1 Tax=Trichonephila clavipes TaxID=2585209 RepID=A0A8X7BIQ8_TRICX|nr:hypothetical protein TNCV_1241211 [Trichonephila clavipes]